MKDGAIVLLGEIRKSLLIAWTYRINTFTGWFTLAFVFITIGFMLGGGQLDPERLAGPLLGYLTWMYATTVISDLSYGLRGEISAGTLEQMAMSPAPIGLVLLGRVITNLMTATIEVVLMGAAMRVLLGVRIPMHWQGIPVLAVTLFGVLGFGFMLAGAMLVLKRVESLAVLMNNGLAFLNGTFLPVQAMPVWLAAVARTVPTTQGVIVLRRVVLEGQSLLSVWQDRSLLWLILHSTLYFAAGWAIFWYGERVAKRHGSLGQY